MNEMIQVLLLVTTLVDSAYNYSSLPIGKKTNKWVYGRPIYTVAVDVPRGGSVALWGHYQVSNRYLKVAMIAHCVVASRTPYPSIWDARHISNCAGTNVSKETHHKLMPVNGYDQSPEPGLWYYHIYAYSASAYADGRKLKVDNNGQLIAMVYKPKLVERSWLEE